MSNTIRVWDPLVRLFHWGLVVTFFISYFTGEEESELHIYTGYAVLGLIIFRLLWGFIGTRHARMVRAVVGGTPAYDADIWDGDILLEIEGQPIRGESGYSELLEQHQGHEVSVTIWRDGDIFDLPVQLNNAR